MFSPFQKAIACFLIISGWVPSFMVSASGIVLGGTRVIFPMEQKQTSLSVRNTSHDSRYLVQSWISNADGSKSTDFIITPPVYVSNPDKINDLRIMYSGGSAVQDKETLYYLTSKAIPALDKEKVSGKNMLVLAASTRIKLFLRPKELDVKPDAASSLLHFSRKDDQLLVNNPSPYYITMVNVSAGKNSLKNVMLPPKEKTSLDFHYRDAKKITFQTINDFGGVTKKQEAEIH